MARRTTATANEVWRATIVRSRDGMPTRTEYAGPFLVKGAATAAITRAADRNRRAYGHQASDTVTGTVQRGLVTWEDV